jgi:hypothetical protein
MGEEMTSTLLTDLVDEAVAEWRHVECGTRCGPGCGYGCQCRGCPGSLNDDTVDALVDSFTGALVDAIDVVLTGARR